MNRRDFLHLMVMGACLELMLTDLTPIMKIKSINICCEGNSVQALWADYLDERDPPRMTYQKITKKELASWAVFKDLPDNIKNHILHKCK